MGYGLLTTNDGPLDDDGNATTWHDAVTNPTRNDGHAATRYDAATRHDAATWHDDAASSIVWTVATSATKLPRRWLLIQSVLSRVINHSSIRNIFHLFTTSIKLIIATY